MKKDDNGKTLFQTPRLNIDLVTDEEVDMIIDIESHPLNRDFIWIGTPAEHRDEIRDPNQLLLVFRSRQGQDAAWDPKKDGYRLVPEDVKGYALIRLDFKSNIFEVRRIVITDKGRGYGKESMKALLRYAFEETETNRVWLDVYPDNTGGIYLYEQLGMHRDGVLRQNYKAERGYLDQIIYSMLRSEYEW